MLIFQIIETVYNIIITMAYISIGLWIIVSIAGIIIKCKKGRDKK